MYLKSNVQGASSKLGTNLDDLDDEILGFELMLSWNENLGDFLKR